MFLFNRRGKLVTKEEYEGIKDELNKLKENIQKWVLQLEKKSKKE